jgi:hypothetical protein
MKHALRLLVSLALLAVSGYGCAPAADVQQAGAASTADPAGASRPGAAPSGPAPVAAAPANRPPSINVSAVPAAVAGQAFSLAPVAADADGDALTFDITGKPAWANFDAQTGRLSGTPAAGDVGRASGVVISVSDGKSRVSAAALDVVVQAATGGSAGANVVVEWDVPTTNLDGSSLTDLASYRVVYGQSSGALTQVLNVTDRLATSAQVSGLSAGTWFFAVRAVNQAGQESPLSNIASRMVP